MTKALTAVVVIAVTGALIIYDIIIVAEATPNDTISEIILGFSLRRPIVPWLWGGLSGHLFWPMRIQGGTLKPIPFTQIELDPFLYKWIALGILILVTISLFVLDVTGMLSGLHPVIPLLLGVPAGHWGWPQQRRLIDW